MTDHNSQPQNIVKSLTRQDQVVIVELAGDLDLHHSVEVRGTLLEILNDEQPPLLVVNMAQVDFMDSSGLATLVEALQFCKKHDRKLKLAALQDRVLRVFEISRLDKLFEIHATQAEALAL